MNKEKKHLVYSKMARKALKSGAVVNIDDLRGLPEAETKKEAYGMGCLALVSCKNHGEKISKSDIDSCFNKLKGKEGKTQQEISHIFTFVADCIPGTSEKGNEIKLEMERRSNQNLTKVIAETVLEKIVPGGSINISQAQNGWIQLAIATVVIFGLKLFTSRR